MSLTPGTRLGTYEIAGAIGVGGMGEVYRARDMRLQRDVAIKVLPAAVAGDPDRMARFEREAQLLASLNHPNIATVYGLEDGPTEGGPRSSAIVMELVPGETLADRLARGPLSIDDAIAVARQIADALDAAHEKGIIHRDLKPANIKVTSDGTVKVLDFGLAKLVAAWDADATALATREGVVMGTPAYMSPEQARGQAVDKRTDIWAFGCVVYEMLTARQAFDPPDWSALPAATPPRAVRLLQRCLAKDLKQRLRDLGDAGLDVANVIVASPHSSRGTWIAAAIAVVVMAAAATLAVLLRGGDGERPITRFTVAPQAGMPPSSSFSVSPDGRQLAYVAAGADGVLRLWLRSLDATEARPLAGTESEVAANTSGMIWSPDSRSMAFYADGVIKRVDRAGGAPKTLCEIPAPGVAVGGTWSTRGVIVVGYTAGGLLQCPETGGVARPVTFAAPTANVSHLFPSFLSDDRHVLYLRVSRDDPSQNGLHIADLEAAPDQPISERVIATGFGGRFVADEGERGHVLFVREAALWALPFDGRTRSAIGDAVRIASPIGSFRDGASFSAASDTLVYRSGAPNFQFVWRDRRGAQLGAVGRPGQYGSLTLSSDARRAIVTLEDSLNRADRDLWMLDPIGGAMTRFTFDPLMESVPAWSGDGHALFYAMGPGRSDILRRPLASDAVAAVTPGVTENFRVNALLLRMSATADGRFLAFTIDGRGIAKSDIWQLALTPGASPAPLVQQPYDQAFPQFSPDGRWLAYASSDSRTAEVFVRPLTVNGATGTLAVGVPVLVSRGGGTAPQWRGDSRELFYQTHLGGVMAAAVTPTSVLPPVSLFQAPGALADWGVAPNGERFLLAVPVGETGQAPFNVVLNWRAALTR